MRHPTFFSHILFQLKSILLINIVVVKSDLIASKDTPRNIKRIVTLNCHFIRIEPVQETYTAQSLHLRRGKQNNRLYRGDAAIYQNTKRFQRGVYIGFVLVDNSSGLIRALAAGRRCSYIPPADALNNFINTCYNRLTFYTLCITRLRVACNYLLSKIKIKKILL